MYSFTKRLIDLFLATILLIISFPILIIIFILIFLIDKQYPIFVQERTGFKKKIFNFYKYKTMKNNTITKLGFILRKSRLDELPQIFNVIKNDMSFVGPRPLLVEYLSLYNKKQLQRFEVPQGITCISQINGGNKLSWKRKLTFDIAYIKNKSFCLDLKIMFFTFIIFIKSFFIKETDANVIIKFTKDN
tara:strand:+ start:1024 stop:1590 length:567 start_codon:yes stop_codon:yes gene_type:complete